MKPGGRTNPATGACSASTPADWRRSWRRIRSISRTGCSARLRSLWSASGDNSTIIDGRDIFDNLELIFKHPGGKKMIWSGICTSSHLPLLQRHAHRDGRADHGYRGIAFILRSATTRIPATAMWFPEPPKPQTTKAPKKRRSKGRRDHGVRRCRQVAADSSAEGSDHRQRRIRRYAK